MVKHVLLALTLPLLASAAVKSDMLVSTSWLADHLSDRGVVVLHVAANRTAYDAGHVPGARFVAQADLVVTHDGIPNELPPVADLQALFERLGVSDSSRIVLYADGSMIPAARAYFTLDYLGHGDHTALLDGGLDQWKRENRALSMEAGQVVAGKLTPKVKAEVVAKTDQVKQPAGFSLLDARSQTEYGGANGHIPGAQNVNWIDGQVSRENMTLQSEDALRKLYEAAGITPNKQVVTYCNSGMQASVSYFTLKYLGYDVKLYDGSFSEWTRTPGSAVEKTTVEKK
jgi:thiosulfate/3-mercaptopyruvate sulfurtransferase